MRLSAVLHECCHAPTSCACFSPHRPAPALLLSPPGDSRAVLCRKGMALPLTEDHKPGRADEMVRQTVFGYCTTAVMLTDQCEPGRLQEGELVNRSHPLV